MILLDKLKSIREDWRQDAREYRDAKGVKPFHNDRLKQLNFSLQIKKGPLYTFSVKPHVDVSGSSGFSVSVYRGEKFEYVTYDIFDTAEEVVKAITDGTIINKIYKYLRSKLADQLKRDISREEVDAEIDKYREEMKSLDEEIDQEIDPADLNAKLKKYAKYYEALYNRDSKKDELRRKASRNYESEHKFKVGDLVADKYGRSVLRSGKIYKIDDIKKEGSELKYHVVPENGRGMDHWVRARSIAIASEQVRNAIENPDENTFDQDEYNMKRYAAMDDDTYNEAVETLKQAGMTVNE